MICTMIWTELIRFGDEHCSLCNLSELKSILSWCLLTIFDIIVCKVDFICSKLSGDRLSSWIAGNFQEVYIGHEKLSGLKSTLNSRSFLACTVSALYSLDLAPYVPFGINENYYYIIIMNTVPMWGYLLKLSLISNYLQQKNRNMIQDTCTVCAVNVKNNIEGSLT